MKDSATLTDANGQTHTVVNEKETGSQSLHVDLVGVVDQPHFELGNTGWEAKGRLCHHHRRGWPGTARLHPHLGRVGRYPAR
ncbi:hypothetical protein [Aeromonas ichthyocola]